MTEKQIRKIAIRMLYRRKWPHTARLTHKLAFLIETRGFSKGDARRKLDLSSHVFTHYFKTYEHFKEFARRGITPEELRVSPHRFSLISTNQLKQTGEI
jgi:hypothetical protein